MSSAPTAFSHNHTKKGICDSVSAPAADDESLYDYYGLTLAGVRRARQDEIEALQAAPAAAPVAASVLPVCSQCGGPDLRGRPWLTLKGLEAIGR